MVRLLRRLHVLVLLLVLQMLTVTLICSGSGADQTLSGIGLLWPAVMVASAAFQAGASITKVKAALSCISIL